MPSWGGANDSRLPTQPDHSLCLRPADPVRAVPAAGRGRLRFGLQGPLPELPRQALYERMAGFIPHQPERACPRHDVAEGRAGRHRDLGGDRVVSSTGIRPFRMEIPQRLTKADPAAKILSSHCTRTRAAYLVFGAVTYSQR